MKNYVWILFLLLGSIMLIVGIYIFAGAERSTSLLIGNLGIGLIVVGLVMALYKLVSSKKFKEYLSK